MMKEQKNAFRLDPQLGYFRNEGVNIMAFDDIYPEGHQSGVSILMHGRRIATCGDDGLNAVMKALAFAMEALNDQRCEVDD